MSVRPTLTQHLTHNLPPPSNWKHHPGTAILHCTPKWNNVPPTIKHTWLKQIQPKDTSKLPTLPHLQSQRRSTEDGLGSVKALKDIKPRLQVLYGPMDLGGDCDAKCRHLRKKWPASERQRTSRGLRGAMGIEWVTGAFSRGLERIKVFEKGIIFFVVLMVACGRGFWLF